MASGYSVRTAEGERSAVANQKAGTTSPSGKQTRKRKNPTRPRPKAKLAANFISGYVKSAGDALPGDARGVTKLPDYSLQKFYDTFAVMMKTVGVSGRGVVRML